MKRTHAAVSAPAEAEFCRGSISALIAARELNLPTLSSTDPTFPVISRAPQSLAHAYAHDSRVVSSLRPARRLVGHVGCVNALAFSRSPHAPLLASGSDDSCVKLWSLYARAGRECVASLRGHTSNVFAVDFLAYDTHRIASGGNDGDVLLYDVPTTRVIARHAVHVKKVLSVCASPLWAPTLLSASADGTVRHWDTRLATPVTLLAPDSDLVLPQAFGGGRLTRLGAVARVDSESLLLDVKLRTSAPMPRAVRLGAHTIYAIDTHPLCSSHFIVGSARGTVTLYDVRALSLPLRVFAAEAPVAATLARMGLGECTGAAFSASGAFLAASLLGGPVLVFDTVSGTLLHELRGHRHEATVKGVCFLGDDFVCHGSDDGRVFIWSLSDGALLTILSPTQRVQASTVNVVAGSRDGLPITPEGTMLATAGLDDFVQLWDPEHNLVGDREIRACRQRIMRVEAEAWSRTSPFESEMT